MRAGLQRRIQRYGWDKAAAFYEDAWQRQLEPAQELLLRVAAPRPGERVLDIACGTGLVTFPAAAAVGAGGDVLATDISEAMVAATRTAAESRGFANVRCARMDAERLEVADAAFDLALCGLGLMYVPDPDLALREMYRVLAPGSRAAALVWGERRRCGWAEIFPIVDARVESDVCPLFFQLGTADSLERAFVAAGFTDVATRRLAVDLLFETAEDACLAAFAGGPVALAYDRFDEATREAVHAAYLDSIAAYRGEAGYAVPGEFVVVNGARPPGA